MEKSSRVDRFDFFHSEAFVTLICWIVGKSIVWKIGFPFVKLHKRNKKEKYFFMETHYTRLLDSLKTSACRGLPAIRFVPGLTAFCRFNGSWFFNSAIKCRRSSKAAGNSFPLIAVTERKSAVRWHGQSRRSAVNFAFRYRSVGNNGIEGQSGTSNVKWIRFA